MSAKLLSIAFALVALTLVQTRTARAEDEQPAAVESQDAVSEITPTATPEPTPPPTAAPSANMDATELPSDAPVRDEAPVKGALVIDAEQPEKSKILNVTPEQLAKTPAIFWRVGVEVPLLPFWGVDAHGSLVFLDQKLEVGAGVGGATIPEGFDFFGNTFVQLAPIPGEIGHRFYVKGKLYYVFSLREIDRNWTTRHSIVTGGALGYRHKTRDQKMYFYLELGVLKNFGLSDTFLAGIRNNSAGILPLFSIGFNFR